MTDFLGAMGVLFIVFLFVGSIASICGLISCLVDIYQRLKKLEDKQNERS